MTLRRTAAFLAAVCAFVAPVYGSLMFLTTRFGVLPAKLGSSELTSYDGYVVAGLLATAVILGLCSVDWRALLREGPPLRATATVSDDKERGQ